MKRGEDTVMPNWALDAVLGMTLATDIKVLMWLVRHRGYRNNTYSTKQLAIALEVDPRTMRESLERLRGAGLILSHDGAHCSADANSKLSASQVKAAGQAWEKKCKADARPAQASCNAPASLLQKDPASETNAAVSDGENWPLNKGSNEVMKQASLQEQKAGLPDQNQTREGTGMEHQIPGLPSLEKTNTAELEIETPSATNPTPATRHPLPAAELPSVSPAALGLFMGLFLSHAEGHHFCATNAASLDRWHAAYSPEFVRLAYELVPTLRGVQRASKGFEWLLNRERDWPEALRRQYRTDMQAAEQQPTGDTPQPGEIRVMTDGTGRSGRVLDVDASTRRLTLQIGRDETEAIDVPWAVTQPSVRRSA